MTNYQERNRLEKAQPTIGNLPRPSSPNEHPARQEQPSPGRTERPVISPNKK